MDNIMLTEQTKTSRFLTILFSPNEKMPRYWMEALSVFYFVSFLLLWEFVFPTIIPRLGNIFYELWILVSEQGLLFELGSTLKLVLKAMLFSVPLAGLISFAGHTLNFAKPIANAMPSLRFWTTLGFASIIRIIGGGGDTFQLYTLMFGMVPFMATGFNAVLQGVEKDKLYDYARTMGYSEWKCVWYVVVRNRLGKIYFSIRDNFAIAWLMVPTVEIANRDGGGIGAMLYDRVRFVQSDDPYAAAFALQLMFLSSGVIADRLFRQIVLTLREERVRAKSAKA